LIVRKAEEKDLSEVYNIELSSFDQPYPPQLLYLYYHLSGDLFLVAENAGRVVGYVIGIMGKDKAAHVISLAVHPDFRRRGIGKELLQKLLEALLERGATHVRLEVENSNEAALALYQKLGFRIMGLLRDYYGSGRHAYIMVKTFQR